MENGCKPAHAKAGSKRQDLVTIVLIIDMLAVIISAVVIFALGEMNLESFLILMGVTYTLAVIVFGLLMQH